MVTFHAAVALMSAPGVPEMLVSWVTSMLWPVLRSPHWLRKSGSFGV